MLPVLDLSSADADPDTFRAAVRRAAHEYGFFYLTGHGLPQAQIDEVLSLAREFFALPTEAKNEISQLSSPHFRGYSRLGGELTNGAVDWREQIDIGPERPVVEDAVGYWNLQGPNLWPTTLPEFRRVFEQWSDDLSDVGMRLLRHWAVSLGAPESYFDAAFAERPATLMKVVRYPGSVDNPQGVGAHKDSGVLTLLLVEPGSRGLQVEGRRVGIERGEARSESGPAIDSVQTLDDSWMDVPPREGALIVNTGELLEVASGGYLRATRHRVLAPEPGTDRISIPYFFNPALDAVIEIIDLPTELAALATGVEADPDNPIFSTYGENAWKSRTRAHPDTAEIHHGITPVR